MTEDDLAGERDFNARNIDDKVHIVGSAAGRDSSPAWVFNLRAHPDVRVEIGPDPPKAVTANELPRDDRNRVYRIITERAPGFAEYEQRTDRVIPVFELAPTA
jgi:deazaflavin-dependent oxidoreductase (nitroreductase family)